MTNFAVSVEKLRGKLANAHLVVARYQEEVDKLGGRVSRLRAELPKWVRWAVWGVSFLLGWLGLFQAFMLWRGLRWMARG